MDPLMLFGVVAIPAAAGLLAWTFLGADNSTVSADDLLGGRSGGGGGGGGHTDLREAFLSTSAKDRAVMPFVNSILARLRKLTPVGWADTIEMRLMLSGDTKWTVEKVIGVKLVLLMLGLLRSFSLLGGSGKLWFIQLIGTPVLGFFLPDILIKNKATKRQQLILKSLPDVLDQITVGVEAGLGFDAAMARTAKSNEGPLAQELMRTLQHVAAGLSRAEALRGMATRNKVPELRQFVGAILQAEQYGIPMAQVLRVQAAEQRRRRRQRAEEKAMKLPVKVLFPLVLCILPTLFIVLIGPAAIDIKNKI